MSSKRDGFSVSRWRNVDNDSADVTSAGKSCQWADYRESRVADS